MPLIINIEANLETVKGVFIVSKTFYDYKKAVLIIAHNKIHNNKAVELMIDNIEIELTLDLALDIRHEA